MRIYTEDELYDLFFKEIDALAGEVVFPSMCGLPEKRVNFSDVACGYLYLDELFRAWKKESFEYIEGWRLKP